MKKAIDTILALIIVVGFIVLLGEQSPEASDTAFWASKAAAFSVVFLAGRQLDKRIAKEGGR